MYRFWVGGWAVRRGHGEIPWSNIEENVIRVTALGTSHSSLQATSQGINALQYKWKCLGLKSLLGDHWQLWVWKVAQTNEIFKIFQWMVAFLEWNHGQGHKTLCLTCFFFVRYLKDLMQAIVITFCADKRRSLSYFVLGVTVCSFMLSFTL